MAPSHASDFRSGVWPKVLQGNDMPFKVYIYSHAITSPPRDVPCWTYISDGLEQKGQPEVVFTILRRPNEHEENFTEAPVEWMRCVYGLATGGLNLQTGQMCDLVFENDRALIKLNDFAILQNKNKWMSMQRFGGIVHGISARCALTGIPQEVLPADYHAVIALTHEEAEVARRFGVTRVVSHVGLGVRWFPHPPFVDRDREDSVSMADQVESFRAKLPLARIYGLSGMVIDDDIVLTIPRREETRTLLRKHVQEIPMTDALAFECFMTKAADCGYVWKTGQTKPMMYGAHFDETRHTNLGFIVCTPWDKTNTWSHLEDGFGVILDSTSWKAVRDAMANTQDIVVNLENGADRMRFHLKWEKTVYHNPIDGTEMNREWETYTPSTSGPRPDRPSYPHIEVGEIVLLVQPPSGHVDVHDLVVYLDRVVEVMAGIVPTTPIPVEGNSDVGRQILIELEIPKCEGWLKLAMYPSMDGLSLGEAMPKIALVPQPSTLSTIKFQLFLNVWGYQGSSGHLS
ncbi:hypothetical protein LTR56_010554 [Elasticomyces elasticus]|nr:hypothetical protein LTR56_010554 [Elasticomyces elasticus]KAK3657970.1 hypothetical protein LTR22_009197 [Elasticomyces elasticus]KAK5762877.1 hypothetical protein LTS12_007066 [Elasticomyces elasticus]